MNLKRLRPRWLRRYWYSALALLLIGIFLILVQTASAVVVKLSGEMPDFGDVSAFQVSPDGQYVIFTADKNRYYVQELYSAPIAGGTVTRLNVELDPSSIYHTVYAFAVSPDSTRVVYTASDADGLHLYSVPIAGPAEASIKLTASIGGVTAFKITPNSGRIVYGWDEGMNYDYIAELYSVPIIGPGSAAVKLNRPLLGGSVNTKSFHISADSSRVVYSAPQDTAGVFELYSVPVTGPASAGVKLNQPLAPATGYVAGNIVSPDGTRVVYVAKLDDDSGPGLYSVPITGPASASIEISAPRPSDGYFSTIRFSLDNTRVVYTTYQGDPSVGDLYSVPASGPASANVKLNKPLSPGNGIIRFEISPDSGRVVYTAQQDDPQTLELYSIPITGPAAASIKLNPAPAPGGGIISGTDFVFAITPDSSWVVYRAVLDIALATELYSVPLAGPASAAIKLNEPLLDWEQEVEAFQMSLDSSEVVYLADQDTAATFELYQVPITGPTGSGVKVSGPLVYQGDVEDDFQVTPDGVTAVYRADQEAFDVHELYAADDRPLEVAFSPATAMVGEAEGQATLTVQLNAPAFITTTVDFAVTGGTATGGVDYTLIPGTLTFAPGVTSQTMPVLIVEDTTAEPVETVVIALSNPQNVGLGAAATFTLYIADEVQKVYLPAAVR